MLVDQNSENLVVPLNHNLKSEGRLELANSSLSEMAVLGVRSISFTLQDCSDVNMAVRDWCELGEA